MTLNKHLHKFLSAMKNNFQETIVEKCIFLTVHKKYSDYLVCIGATIMTWCFSTRASVATAGC